MEGLLIHRFIQYESDFIQHNPKICNGDQTPCRDLFNPWWVQRDRRMIWMESHLSLYSDQFFCLFATSPELGWWSRANRSKFKMKRSSCRWQHPMKMDWSEMKAEVCPWLCLVSHDFSLYCNLPVGFAKTNSILWRLNFKSLKRLKLGEDWFELRSGVKFGSGIPRF